MAVYRRRIRLVTDEGEPFLLDLAEAARLGEGDGLALEDGGYVRVVVAAEEPVADLNCQANSPKPPESLGTSATATFPSKYCRMAP